MVANAILQPLKAIQQNCLDCMGGPLGNRRNFNKVKNCTTRDCPLWPYRFGIRAATAAKQGRDVTP